MLLVELSRRDSQKLGVQPNATSDCTVSRLNLYYLIYIKQSIGFIGNVHASAPPKATRSTSTKSLPRMGVIRRLVMLQLKFFHSKGKLKALQKRQKITST